MKFIKHFDEFMKDVVNLNQTRIDEAKTKSDSIESFIKDNVILSPMVTDIMPQGSYKHKTIIKPQWEDGEFDVDLMVVMKEQAWREPKDYLSKISDEFKNSGTYKDKVNNRGKTRCVTIDYVWEFHIDVVPCKKTDNVYEIMNKKENVFEQTDGNGYAEWFEKQNKITWWMLKRVIRLLKYLRDTGQFQLKSVILTTLLAKRIIESDSLYVDLPTAFSSIVGLLNRYLEINPLLLTVDLSNPALSSEKFTRNIDQTIYDEFRTYIADLNQKIQSAIAEDDKAKSMEKWRWILGADFGYEDDKNAISKAFSMVTLNHVKPISWIVSWWESSTLQDIRIDCFTYKVNNKLYESQSYKTNTLWEALYKLASWTWNLKKLRTYSSGTWNLPKRILMRFTAKNLPADYDKIYRQVVNTWAEAKSQNSLRWDFEENHINKIQIYEETAYSWHHRVQCFVVKNNMIIAKSEKFYVKIW